MLVKKVHNPKTTIGNNVTIVTDCPYGKGTTHAIFGDTTSIKGDLLSLNGWAGYKDLVKYNAKLHFGAGWIISDESRIKEVTDKLDEIGKPYDILTSDEYRTSSKPDKSDKIPLIDAIREFNMGKIDPEKCFVKGSSERENLLSGQLSFPLEWAKESVNYKGVINKEGLRSDACFRRALKNDLAFASKLYEKEIIDITTDTLYDCCDISSDTALDIATSILTKYKNIPLGYWKRSISLCLIKAMFQEFSPKIKLIARELVARGGDINDPYIGSYCIQSLVQQYHRFPKRLTPEKLEFMFQCGLKLNGSFSSTSGTAFLPPQITLESMFTNGIPLDEYIEMLQIIKKYRK
jgi:hypothetical protein